MSKVHEALKRAQEERSVSPRSAAEPLPSPISTQAPLAAEPCEIPQVSALADVSPRVQAAPHKGPILPGRATEVAADVRVLTAEPQLSRLPTLPDRLPQS